MHVTGSCHCGAIRYEAEVDPDSAGICHCTDCHVLSGTAFRVFVRAAPGTFKLLAGTPREYIKTTADSGAKRVQSFCGTCGSPIYATSPEPDGRIYSLRAGTIDQRAQLRVAGQIWTRSRLHWVDELATAPGREKQS